MRQPIRSRFPPHHPSLQTRHARASSRGTSRRAPSTQQQAQQRAPIDRLERQLQSLIQDRDSGRQR